MLKMTTKPPTDELTDSLDDLPADSVGDDDIAAKSLQQLETVVRTQQRQKMGLTAKEVGYATIIFIFLTLPISDKLLAMVMPSVDDSIVIKTAIKGAIFFVLLYLIVHPWNK